MRPTAEPIRIAVLDDYQNVALRYADWSPLQGRAEVCVFNDHLSDPQAVVDRLREFDVVCVMRERTPLTAAMLSQLPRMALIVTTAMGNAAIDVEAALKQGAVVCGTGAVHNGTPELIWLHVLALARQLSAEQELLRAGRWQFGVGCDLDGATMGIVGLGRMGSRVARVALAFGMHVVAWSQNLTPERAAENGARYVDKESLFRESDFVVTCLQLGPRTRGVIGARELSLMKPSAYFINTSRAPLVDEPALIAALRDGRIAGAGIDVFEQEPLAADHPLRSLRNVFITPHLGYVTEAQYRLFYGETVEDIVAWLNGAPIRCIGFQRQA